MNDTNSRILKGTPGSHKQSLYPDICDTSVHDIGETISTVKTQKNGTGGSSTEIQTVYWFVYLFGFEVPQTLFDTPFGGGGQ